MKISYNEKNDVDIPIAEELNQNIEVLDALFHNWGDIVKKKFVLQRHGRNLDIYIIYIDGLTNNEMVERTITHPLLYEWEQLCERNKDIDDDLFGKALFDSLFHAQTEAVDLISGQTMQDAISAVLKGDTAIFVDHAKECMILSTKKFPTRSVSEPEKEAGIRGPKDSFIENFRTNTALLRRRIKDPKLKLEQGEIGERSRTIYGLMYMEDFVYPALLGKVKEKIDSFEIDGI